MKSVAALDLRKRLGSILDAVSSRKEGVVIQRANKPLAVLISVEEYEEKVLGKDRGRKLRDVADRMEAWRQAHRKEAAAVDAVRAVRAGRTGR